MNINFSIGEAAKAVHATSETLRHYDRIGLVKPSQKDAHTKYRYYTQQDIVRLSTVRALRQMDMSLQEIKQILEYDDLQKIVDNLAQADKKAEMKIAQLQYSRTKIAAAKADYEKKLLGHQERTDVYVKTLPARTILLSDCLESPSLDNLWNYLSHFFDRLDPAIKDQFAFEDMAGIYSENGVSRLFAVCLRYVNVDGLKVLPAGKYLCADCTEENKESILTKVKSLAKNQYGTDSSCVIQQIIVSGILKWNYQVQMFLGNQPL